MYCFVAIGYLALDFQIYNQIQVSHIFLITILSSYIGWAVPITQCFAPITHLAFLITNIKHTNISLLVELEELRTERGFKSTFASSVFHGLPAVIPSVKYANAL